MYRKYRIVESIASSVSQYESYRDQVYRYTPTEHWDSSAENQERVIGRYSKVPLAVYAHQNKAALMAQNGLKYDHKSAK